MRNCRRQASNFVGLIAAVAALGAFAPAPANAAVSYVARNGSGAACTLAAPCLFMSTAVSVAGVGGEVVCLDRGAYGTPFTISQAVTISCGDGLWEAPATSFTINVPPGQNVVIEGLVMDGLGLPGPAITVSGQGSVHLRRTKIGNYAGANSHGIAFTTAGSGTLMVTDSIIYNNGGYGILVQPTLGLTNVRVVRSVFNNNTTGGITIGPTSGASTKADLSNVVMTGGNFGVAALDGASVTVSDSVLSENAYHGAIAYSASGPTILTLIDSEVSNNGVYGVVAVNPAAAILLGKTTVTGNSNGIGALSGSRIFSYGDNRVNGNSGLDGTPTQTIQTR